jgi:hypothetical protein
MTAEEFERQVIAGEITDFEPYLKETGSIKEDLRNKAYRLILLAHGIEIERILELDGAFAISTCIREGWFPERYDEWKDRNEEWILETFAENGYYLDELIESEYDDVQKAVIENNPEFCIERLNQGKIYQIIHDYIKNKAKPNIALFKAYIDTLKSNNNYMGLMTKYRALTNAPSTIEKTMNDVQLFESGSPMWTTDLTIQQIRDVLDACKELERQGYSEFVDYLLTEVRNPGYDRERLTTSLPVLAVNYQWYKLEQEMRKNR